MAIDKVEFHHNIPISIGGENIKENGFYIDSELHKDLHDSQNIRYKHIRKYREKVNGILIPNDYSLDLKGELIQKYFENARIEKQKQLNSLNNQIIYYRNKNEDDDIIIGFDLEKSITLYIDQQKKYIKRILKIYKIT